MFVKGWVQLLLMTQQWSFSPVLLPSHSVGSQSLAPMTAALHIQPASCLGQGCLFTFFSRLLSTAEIWVERRHLIDYQKTKMTA